MCDGTFGALGNCLRNAKTEQAACKCYGVDCPPQTYIETLNFFSFGPSQRTSSANKTYMIGVKTSSNGKNEAYLSNIQWAAHPSYGKFALGFTLSDGDKA
jgi:hypothetical protein